MPEPPPVIEINFDGKNDNNNSNRLDEIKKRKEYLQRRLAYEKNKKIRNREDLHFRIDEETYKKRKQQMKEAEQSTFGPELPPLMALKRQQMLEEQEMQEQVGAYVVDLPNTRLKRLIEHMGVSKSIMEMF
eukprot:g5019.t1